MLSTIQTVTNTFTSISIHFLITCFFFNKNRGLFQFNSEIHDLNTRFNYNLHLPSTNLTSVHKAVLYSGSKLYNHLPSTIKILLSDAKRFKSKNYLIEHTMLFIVRLTQQYDVKLSCKHLM